MQGVQINWLIVLSVGKVERHMQASEGHEMEMLGHRSVKNLPERESR